MSKLGFFECANTYTQDKLEKIRRELTVALENSPYKEHITLVATGSYGRSEASDESDLDWFLIFDKDLDPKETIPNEIQRIVDVISQNIACLPGDTQTFGEDAIVKFGDMQSNIGGEHDTNASLTRRLLFLLEGTWLYGESRFRDYRKKLLEKYIKSDASIGQLPYFFLNDVIRYYRTMATDFEYKVAEGGKSWGLRNIKLRFSRKLLYFGGVIVIAELNGLNWENKLLKAEELFDQSILERIKHLGLELESDKTEEILSLYSGFLEKLSDPCVRTVLSECSKEDRDKNSEYIELKESGESFSKALHAWLNEKYPNEHPIHHALVF